jgi:hypothetical protein
MAYNPRERSVLETQFERLFQETFHCSVETLLNSQHKVDYKGQWYRIDYAYISPKTKIAIELDGRSKFKSKDYYNYFMSRHNALENSDFKVYHLTWDDVTSNGGINAKAQLMEIFLKVIKDQESTDNVNKNELTSQVKQLNRAFDDFKRVFEQEKIHQQNSTKKQILNSKQNFEKLSKTLQMLQAAIDNPKLGEPYQQSPPSQDKLEVASKNTESQKLIIVFTLCLIVVLVGFIVFSNKPVLSPPAQEASVTDNTVQSQLENGHSIIDSEQNDYIAPKVSPPEKTRTTAQPFPSPQTQRPQKESVSPPQDASELEKPVEVQVEQVQPPVRIKPHEQILTASSIVLFNEKPDGSIYHNPDCPIAKTCKNCVPMTKAEAEERGGRKSKLCYFPR